MSGRGSAAAAGTRPPPVRIDDLADPRFAPEVEEMRAAMTAMATEIRLEPDALLEAAVSETGLDRFGDGGFRERLDVLCAAMRTDAGFGPVGIVSAYALLVGLLFRSQEPAALEGGEAYRVDERVQWDHGGATITRVSFVRRAPGLTHAQFADHWTTVHAPLARQHHPGICRYVQNVVVETLTPGAPDVDGIAELGFASLDDLRARMYDSPAGQAAITADVGTFIDVPAGWRMLARVGGLAPRPAAPAA